MEGRRHDARTLFPAKKNHWVFQCKPAVWDVFKWWEEQRQELPPWRVTPRNSARVAVGDDAAFWIAGEHAGVYGIGTVRRGPESASKLKHGERSYWCEPPLADYLACELDIDRYLFAAPVRKRALVEDPDFADARIIRMPGGGNPLPLSDSQWAALERHASLRPAVIGAPDRSKPIVIERPLRTKLAEPTSFTSPQEERKRRTIEAQLVVDYQQYLNRSLVVHSVTLPSGERLVTDAYDAETVTLIEAKASSSRPDVRMALGQLLDYARFLTPKPRLAVLLPHQPSNDLAELLAAHEVSLIVETESGFVVS